MECQECHLVSQTIQALDQALLIVLQLLAYLNFELTFILCINQSSSLLGSVSYQIQNEKLRVIGYGSRALNEANCKTT